jgi:uncharacterized protein YbcI
LTGADGGYAKGMPESSLPREDTAEELIRAAEDAASPGQGAMRTAISNAIVGLLKQYWGRGPTGAKTYLCDDYVFVALEGGLTRNEETLLAAGRENTVRAFRLEFQEVVREAVVGAVEDIVGRRVIGYHSQVIFTPPRAFEILVLEPTES